ncbi:MAG TPA: saccharopine dehydrogenase C-terminal domain-containing protein [Longimicrobiales bacterium]|nr:saccharopine dehydrogenase C-terminal domain-containing protein [Longimicrobiales bacterium]
MTRTERRSGAGKRFLVLGGGAQGSACALDLARSPNVERVVVADVRAEPAPFLRPYVGEVVETRALDARDAEAVRSAMEGVDAVACALPYYFNADVARLALEAGVHFCDLGGNTAIVEEQIALADRAREAGVSLVPDCGLAPGMVNILAQAGIDALDDTDSVRMYVGGLPQRPEPPLGYQVVYSLEGVLDYYTTPVLVLKDGAVAHEEPLGGLEEVDFPGLGTLEAFLTAGGVSRMPQRYAGRIRHMAYKTLRYPGHAAAARAMRDLGLFSTEEIDVKGCRVRPRDVFIAVASPVLRRPEGRDLVALRVVVEGTRGGARTCVTYELLDRYDDALGVTAMMRTTGYSLAAVARLQAEGGIASGAWTPEECVPAEAYVAALAERGIRIERRLIEG